METSFYNTNCESGLELKESRRKASRQELLILNYYKRHPNSWLSPSHLLKVFNNWPLTSIRRAITNLTKSGHLIKTTTRVMGLYGKKEHCWRLKQQFRETLFDE